ncbi:hypothetical protein [Erythrobacter aureus]|uniref:Uncharacterized protein n=1 Tax=Erythrobacter aureus TaxID=2182384 RepID=A0A345YIW4_9SPHN|nr:hypothetical protein [Erythrobacter aureus]AXK43866.1 hypothetical protein DVR09_15540 [Erythrobacter aureus]
MNNPRHSVLIAQAILHSFTSADADEQKTIVLCQMDRNDPIGMASMGAANVLKVQHDITDVRWLFEVEAKLQSDIVLLIYAKASNSDAEFARLKEALASRGPGCIPVIQCVDMTPEEFSARSGIGNYIPPAAAYAERPAEAAKQVSADADTAAGDAGSEQLAA